MAEINLYSVLDKLINEDQSQAKELLHQWFLEACSSIQNQLNEEVHVHVHQDGGEEDEGVREQVGGSIDF